MNNDMEPDSIFRVRDDANTCVSSRCRIRSKSKSLCRIRHYRLMRRGCVFSGLQRHTHYAAQYINRSPESGTRCRRAQSVPDGMVVWDALADVENHPER